MTNGRRYGTTKNTDHQGLQATSQGARIFHDSCKRDWCANEPYEFWTGAPCLAGPSLLRRKVWYTMSGVWNFNGNGVFHRVENPLEESSSPGPSSGHKILVHCASNEIMSSYEQLDAKLLELGWQAFSRHQHVRQYHRSHSTSDLISLPQAFASIRTTHMYDIVVKSRSAFKVCDA